MISVNEIAPAYLFAKEKIKKEYDERFNLHRYISTHNETWKQLEHGEPITIFDFKLINDLKLDVEKVEVKIKLFDQNKESVFDIPIEGLIANGDTQPIGTLSPPEGSTETKVFLTRSEFNKRRKRSCVDQSVDRWTTCRIIRAPSDATYEVTHATEKTEESTR